MLWREFLKERGVDVWCPYDREGDRVITGMNCTFEPSGKVVGEFWYDKDGQVQVEFYNKETEK